MTEHIVSAEAYDTGDGAVLEVLCSCGKVLLGDALDVVSMPFAEIGELVIRHMEETFPARLIEEMNRPVKISAAELGLSDDEARRLFGPAS